MAVLDMTEFPHIVVTLRGSCRKASPPDARGGCASFGAPELDESHRLGFRVSDAWVFLGGKCAPATVSRSYWLSKRCSHRAPRDSGLHPKLVCSRNPIILTVSGILRSWPSLPANFGLHSAFRNRTLATLKPPKGSLSWVVNCLVSLFGFLEWSGRMCT